MMWEGIDHQVGLSDFYKLAPTPGIAFFLPPQLSFFKTDWLSDLHSLLSYILLPWQHMHALLPVLENPGQKEMTQMWNNTHASPFCNGCWEPELGPATQI